MYLKLVANTPYPQFDVIDEDKLVVRIKIDKEMQALRITCKDNKRVFFLLEEKLRKNDVFTLLNEYSQPLGAMCKDKFSSNEGVIEIEGMKLTYRTSETLKETEIKLLENDRKTPVLSCQLNENILTSYSNYLNYFLFALSWFAFLSKVKEPLEFA